LDYAVEPKVECLDDDPNDAAFIQATTTIGGHDAVEEYLVCKIYLLDAGFSFRNLPMGTTPVSKVETPYHCLLWGLFPWNMPLAFWPRWRWRLKGFWAQGV
jgi:hypothetical protein